MKRFALIILLLSLFLSACAPAPVDTAEENRDSDNRFRYWPGRSFVETENAYIGADGQFLHFWDKETGESGILCAKPECLHNGENCGAYYPGYTSSLGFYDGKLYWFQRMPPNCGLWRMDPDGTNREFFRPLDRSSLPPVGLETRFHRGKAWFLSASPEVIEGEPQTTLALYTLALEGDEDFSPAFSRVYSGSLWNTSFFTCGDGAVIILREAETDSCRVLRWTQGESDVTEVASLPLEGAVINASYVTVDGEIFVALNSPVDGGSLGVLWKAEDGHFRKVIEFRDGDTVYNYPFMGENIVIASAGGGQVRQLWVCDLEGRTLYKGPWELPAGEGFREIIPMGGQDNWFIYHISGGFIKYDFSPDGIQETLLWK
ncbi:MAG: hypothetical protein II794_08170 [Oscillospiraceae bacterium]|nr:hypothetical protein [Oscillospiraceae bacterium]